MADSKSKQLVRNPPSLPIRLRMNGRNIDEMHRASTPLEALFDLTSAVAVSVAATRLYHDLLSIKSELAFVRFMLAFMAIWWPWMSFTWFSSAYDTDDVPYRISTFVQMVGVLLIAAGLPETAAVNITGVLGFTLMRIALVILWLRASVEHKERRVTCLRYATATTVLQLLWIANALWIPSAWLLLTFIVLMMLEFIVPMWAAKAGETPWHPNHIAERYGFFTIILLGECMAGAASAINNILKIQGFSLNLVVASVATVGLIMGLWWAYFLVPFTQVLRYRRERGFVWGYGHALVFAALAILGGVLLVVADVLIRPETQPYHLVTPVFAIALTAATVSIFLGALWWLGGRMTQRRERSMFIVFPVWVISGLSVIFVYCGLPLDWGLLLLACGPVVMISWVMFLRHRQPDAFAVQ
ncbi:low temperature requirement protein A [uncultured Tolumonas sp.]|uniref:low temperature requirement protein A n=1 Tax=uncultured Tolumonas sp. TaxID=263765 RepID=UPI002A0A64FC|nr:low temperature requirement protein A [uncultured Tolumonas sp.]